MWNHHLLITEKIGTESCKNPEYGSVPSRKGSDLTLLLRHITASNSRVLRTFCQRSEITADANFTCNLSVIKHSDATDYAELHKKWAL